MRLLLCSSIALKKGWAGVRVEAAAQARDSGRRLWPSRGPCCGSSRSPCLNSFWPVQEGQAWKEAQGAPYDLKAFHEAFLAQGTAPVKYIRQALLPQGKNDER